MAQLYFITATDVNTHTDVQQNAVPEYFEPRLKRCQEDYIKPVLGVRLYEELCAAMAAEPGAPMPDNLDNLHEQIMPVHAQWVFYKSLTHMVVKATNKGLKPGEMQLSDAQYRTYREAVREEAESRTRDLRDWLEKHKADYPNYQAISAQAPRPIGGIVL